MGEYYAYAIPELIRLPGSWFREYRMRPDMTQKQVSQQSGIFVTTIHKFENGVAANLSLGTLLQLLKAIGQIEQIDNLLPELPESPYLYVHEKKIQRIRHKKQKL